MIKLAKYISIYNKNKIYYKKSIMNSYKEQRKITGFMK